MNHIANTIAMNMEPMNMSASKLMSASIGAGIGIIIGTILGILACYKIYKATIPAKASDVTSESGAEGSEVETNEPA